MGRRSDLPVKATSQNVMDELFASVPVYESTTNGIQIRIQVFWLPNFDDEEDDKNAWIYRCSIRNLNNSDVQIVEQHWETMDSEGFSEQANNTHEETIISSGDCHESACFTSLATPSGFMKGYCAMRFVGENTCFTAPIPPFSLDSPFEENQQIH